MRRVLARLIMILVPLITGCGARVTQVQPSETLVSARTDNLMDSSHTTLAISPTGDCFAVGFANGDIGLWNVKGNRLAKATAAHKESVGSLSFSSDGERLMSDGKDDVRIWSSKDLSYIQTCQVSGRRYMDDILYGDRNTLVAIDSHEPDSGRLVAYDSESSKSTVVFDLAKSKLRKSQLNGGIRGIAYCASNHLCAATYWEETVIIDSTNWQEKLVLPGAPGAGTESPVFSRDGRWLGVVADRKCYLYELEGSKARRTIVLPEPEVETGDPRQIAFSSTGDQMAVAFVWPVAAKRSSIGIFDIKGEKWSRTFRSCDSIDVYGLGFIDNDQAVVVCAAYGEVRIYNLRDGKGG